MKPMRQLLLGAAALLLGWSLQAAAAPGGYTDCSKADLADEKAICSDLPLVQEDARMVTLYKVALSLSGMGVRGDLQDGQTAWLERRHACKADLACLRAAYGARIDRLQAVIDAISSRGPF
jgi:uncharacterized protein